jgi:flagellar L-ring protein FlgH
VTQDQPMPPQSRSCRSRGFVPIIVGAMWALLPAAAGAQSKIPIKNPLKGKPDQVQTSLQDYLTSVRAMTAGEQRTTGSLWYPAAPMVTSAGDYKARYAGDLIVISVVDNFNATTNGSVQAQRAFNATSGVSSFFGNLAAGNALQNIFSPSSTDNLAGKGQSALSSTLSLNLAGRVIEALPNGVLVIEAVRNLNVGNDRQTIVIHGLVRPGDIERYRSVVLGVQPGS